MKRSKSNPGTMRTLLRTAALLLLALEVASEARAATIFTTPAVFIGTNQFVGCSVNNVGTEAATATVEVIDSSGNTVAPFAGSCAGTTTLSPKQSCQDFANGSQEHFCMVTSSSKKIRVALNVVSSTNAVVTVVPGARK